MVKRIILSLCFSLSLISCKGQQIDSKSEHQIIYGCLYIEVDYYTTNKKFDYENANYHFNQPIYNNYLYFLEDDTFFYFVSEDPPEKVNIKRIERESNRVGKVLYKKNKVVLRRKQYFKMNMGSGYYNEEIKIIDNYIHVRQYSDSYLIYKCVKFIN